MPACRPSRVWKPVIEKRVRTFWPEVVTGTSRYEFNPAVLGIDYLNPLELVKAVYESAATHAGNYSRAFREMIRSNILAPPIDKKV